MLPDRIPNDVDQLISELNSIYPMPSIEILPGALTKQTDRDRIFLEQGRHEVVLFLASIRHRQLKGADDGIQQPVLSTTSPATAP